MKRKVELQNGDILLVTDIQNDFLPGGSLGVARGDEVIEPLNRYIEMFEASGLPIYATRDWHPPHHSSFKEQGGIWPAHCVQESYGAQFSSALHLPEDAKIISKATRLDQDAYSSFKGTTLDEQLKREGIRRIFIGGLTTDYCILNTVKDALALHYIVYVLLDAIRAVNVNPGEGDRAIAEMRRLGAELIEISEVEWIAAALY